MRWHRYIIVIVGRESGNVTDLDFLRFRTFRSASRMATQLNFAAWDNSRRRYKLLAYFSIRNLKTGQVHYAPEDS